jgi:hypothetical protein
MFDTFMQKPNPPAPEVIGTYCSVCGRFVPQLLVNGRPQSPRCTCSPDAQPMSREFIQQTLHRMLQPMQKGRL